MINLIPLSSEVVVERRRAFLPGGSAADTIQLLLAMTLQVVLVLLVFVALWESRWLVAFTAAGFVGLTFLPSLLKRQFGLFLPNEVILLNTFFLFGSFALGEFQRFYERFWWWDLMLHGLSAFVMGMFGFLVIYIYEKAGRITVRPFFMTVVAYCIAIAIGAMWEVFEFLMDYGFGFNMQKSGLVDTMTDMMMNQAGALVAVVIGYIYVRTGKGLFIGVIARKLVKLNPHLFKKMKARLSKG